MAESGQPEPGPGPTAKTKQYYFNAMANLFLENVEQKQADWTISVVSRLNYARLFSYLVDMPETPCATKHRMAICALLKFSTEERFGLTFVDHKNLLMVLMAHAGIYSSCFYREYIHANYGHSFDSFWKRCVKSSPIRSLLCENLISKAGRKRGRCCGLCDCAGLSAEFLAGNAGPFHDIWSQLETKHNNGIGKVILMIAQIIKNVTIRNVSNYANAKLVASDTTCSRFIVMLLNCSPPELKTMGVDILTIISSRMVIYQHLLSKTFLTSVPITGEGLDIKNSLRHMKIFQNWCHVAQNREDIDRGQNNYEQIKSYVNLNEIAKLLFDNAANKCVANCAYILETVWTFSRLGKSSCNDICNDRSLIHLLLTFITWKVGNEFVNDVNYSSNKCGMMTPENVSNSTTTKANDSVTEDTQQQTNVTWEMFKSSLEKNGIPNGILLPKNLGDFSNIDISRNETASLRSTTSGVAELQTLADIVVKASEAIIRDVIIFADQGHRTVLPYKFRLTRQKEYDPADTFLPWLLTKMNSS